MLRCLYERVYVCHVCWPYLYLTCFGATSSSSKLLATKEKAAGYRWLHNHAHLFYKKHNDWLSYPSIVMRRGMRGMGGMRGTGGGMGGGMERRRHSTPLAILESVARTQAPQLHVFDTTTTTTTTTNYNNNAIPQRIPSIKRMIQESMHQLSIVAVT